MKILDSELETLGYRRCGLVTPDETPLHFVGRKGLGLFSVQIDDQANIAGPATYVHVMDNEFMKCGIIKPGQTMRSRMNGSYNCLRKPIDLFARGLICYVDETLYWVDQVTGTTTAHYPEDFPWKHRVPPAMLDGHTVVLWGKRHDDESSMAAEETALNNLYRGDWAKEGWSDRRSPDGRPLRQRIRATAI